MFCACINGACKQRECRFWSKVKNDCAIGIYYDVEIQSMIELEEMDQSGLIKCTQSLERTMTSVMMRQFIRSNKVSESERAILENNYKVLVEKREALDLERLYKR